MVSDKKSWVWTLKSIFYHIWLNISHVESPIERVQRKSKGELKIYYK